MGDGSNFGMLEHSTWLHFPVLVLTLELKMRESFKLPPFAGSMFRGVLGWALKEVCGPSLYSYLFETVSKNPGQADASRPFVLIPPLEARQLKAEERLVIELRLLGSGCEYLPEFIEALLLAGDNGLGRQKARFELSKILVDDGARKWVCFDSVVGWDGAYQPLPSALGAFLKLPIEFPSSLELRFETPTRLVYHGAPAESPDFVSLMRALYRRINGIVSVHSGECESLTLLGQTEELAAVFTEHEVEWVDWERTSNRQRRRHVMGGFVGAARYHGDFRPEWLALLKAGEILHIGKATTFGMGRYRVSWP